MKQNCLIRQYASYKEGQFQQSSSQYLSGILEKHGLAGYEVYMDDIVPRGERLFSSEAELDALAKKLTEMQVKRLHCSYWAYPTSFLGGFAFRQLISRFGSLEEVEAYYGDLTGQHMYERWTEEYKLAKAIGAAAYTFHLIDYAPIDGMWEFTIPQAVIKSFMVTLLQTFLNRLYAQNLVDETSPLIEVESCGWGLEHGAQCAEDFKNIFAQIYDPWHRVKIAWEMNHLMHALGYDNKSNRAVFFLPPCEITPEMRLLEEQYGDKPEEFAFRWLESQITQDCLIDHLGSVHVSDCGLKETEYFRNGALQGEYYDKIRALSTWDEKENYGVQIVLTHYDNHLPIGKGILNPQDIKKMLQNICEKNAGIVLLHELKNSSILEQDIETQLQNLWG